MCADIISNFVSNWSSFIAWI